VSPWADQRVEDVAAVELADRHQVERRDEDAHPTGKEPGVERQVVVFGNRPMYPSGQPLQQEGIAVLQRSFRRIDVSDGGSADADHGDGQSENKSRQWSADRDVKQFFAVGNSGTLYDHRSHRAER